MVGEGVLHECLSDPRIATITLLNRRNAGIVHPKVREVLVSDLFTLTEDEPVLQFADACFYCIGVTPVRKSEEEYALLTHDSTLKIAGPVLALNNGMTFIYIPPKELMNQKKERIITSFDMVKLSVW
ncbi:hypothetical protein SAMN05421788_104218 [Filimonas lacunae]|uniref:Uncharacterized protein n=1 Tax=Filimonas lacunae TaxID=477680 RepID=A0A1N7PZQ5_9BACT|nr:hypothetical protein [Filimonas lacunae]SIT16092.1 hypothetical protein SAMN05421788_104218 [Filimonas lacunae]